MRPAVSVVLRAARFVKPALLPTIPILPTRILSAGVVQTDRNAIDACYAWNAALGTLIYTGAKYVDTAGGSDAAAGDIDTPWLTLSKAIRTTAGTYTRVYLSGSSAVGSGSLLFRNLDTSQGGGPALRHVLPWPGMPAPRLYVAGDDIATLTWSATGGQAGVYEATVVTTNIIYKVAQTNSLDAWGYPNRLHIYASVALLQAAGTGFFFDSATKKIYVALGGTDVETVKATLKAYYKTSGGLARVFVQNAPILFENILFDGVVIRGLAAAQAPAIFQPQVWTSGCTFLNGVTTGIQGDGALIVTENARIHASDGDNILLNGPSVAVKSLGLTINIFSTMAGDTQTGNQLVENANSVSAHGGCDHAVFGGRHSDCFGPCIRDIGAVGYQDASWLVGALAANSVPTTGLGFSFTPTGDATTLREAWLDECVSIGNPVGDLQVSVAGDGSIGKAHVHRGSMPVRDGAGVMDTYRRSNP